MASSINVKLPNFFQKTEVSLSIKLLGLYKNDCVLVSLFLIFLRPG